MAAIALFGAGHLACAFANFMGVTDLIDFVADDTPQKQNKFLPGARLPILPSAALAERKIAYYNTSLLDLLLFDWSNRFIHRDTAPVSYWITMGFQLMTLAGCLVVAIHGWWHPNS